MEVAQALFEDCASTEVTGAPAVCEAIGKAAVTDRYAGHGPALGLRENLIRGTPAVRSVVALNGSACGPVIVPVFKTGGRQVFLLPVGSTPTRFRHLRPYTWCTNRQLLFSSD